MGNKGVRPLKGMIQAGIWAVLFAWPLWHYLSWPNRDEVPALVQTVALIGLIYQFLLLIHWRKNGSLPDRRWPMRLSALVAGAFCGMALVPLQVNTSMDWFEQRQQPLLRLLDAAPNRCEAFRQQAEGGRGRTPYLYVAPRSQEGEDEPRYVLVYGASAGMESLVIYYYSFSRKWKAVKTSNRDGMAEFDEIVGGLQHCRVS